MKTIFADFNAINAAGNFWLSCRGSEHDLREAGVRVGDWIWLSDGELIVGAQLALDDVEGPVGIPRWKTLVHLDDEDTQEVSDVRKQVLQLPGQADHDLAVEVRMFQLLTILEIIDPQGVKKTLPFGSIAFRRAAALFYLGELELALLVLQDALGAWSGDPNLGFLHMEILRRVDPDRANAEAGRRAEVDGADAWVLAACINVRSAVADHVSDEDFAGIGPQILEWVARFERAPGRDQVEKSLLALVLSNEGLTLLRLGRFGEAREALGRARSVNPNDSAIAEASRLETYDDRARQIALQLHEMPPLVAA